MIPADCNIKMTRGDQFSLFTRIKKKSDNTYPDITGWTGKAKIKVTPDDVPVLATFTVTLANQTTYPGGILVSLDDSVTSTLTFAGPELEKVIGVWDLEMTNTLGEPNTYLYGTVTLRKDVS